MPAVTTLERLCAAALVRAERKVPHDLAHDLDREQIARLERLLTPRPEGGASWLAWVRQPTEEASAAAFIAIIERLDHVRALGLEAARALRVPRHHLLRLSREAERFSAGHLRDLSAGRRRGILVAMALELGSKLTDAALDLHDRLVGRMFRRAERRQLAALGDDRRLINRTIRLFTRVGDEPVAAKAEGRDAFAAIDGTVGWERFMVAVDGAKGLNGRHGEDPIELLGASYAHLRRHTPLLLASFTFRGVPAVRPCSRRSSSCAR